MKYILFLALAICSTVAGANAPAFDGVLYQSNGFENDAKDLVKAFDGAILYEDIVSVIGPTMTSESISPVDYGRLVTKYKDSLQDGSQSLSPSEVAEDLSPTADILADHPLIKTIAQQLTKDSKTDIEKLIILHNFVLWRITYSWTGYNFEATAKGKVYKCFYNQHQNGEVTPDKCGLRLPTAYFGDDPIANVMFATYIGVHNCRGYAYLFASLARAAGIPTRIARETKTRSIPGHFWTQVFVKGQWLVVDPTFDESDMSNHSDMDPNRIRLVNFEYFLISPKMAAQLDPKNHKDYFTEYLPW